MAESFLCETELLLREACEKLEANACDEPLSSAAVRLVQCAMRAVAILAWPEKDAASEMLGYARAAVTAAVYATWEIDGRVRRGGAPAGSTAAGRPHVDDVR
ncbi:MAG: hypothetical protein GEV28_00180 [Actinophytocola sp.]|uniref:hypothetical protein n=1 Tax=Actinophytocola sp. TaxID=1872138 RepID=UPI00132449B0|nr:hypothetical protein [Actinophytocola sp.]MPZ78888.1 hypothetical protein [Actinophytocola sp.]